MSTDRQYDMFPNVIPQIVQRIWAAKERHFARSNARFTREACESLLETDLGRKEWAGLPCSKSTIDRARKDYPDLLPWPLKKWMRPSWEDNDNGPVSMKPDDSPPAAPPRGEVRRIAEMDEKGNLRPVDAVIDDNGFIRVVKSLGPSAATIAAVFSGGMLALDGMDGRIDHAIRWCRIVAEMMGR